MSILKVLTINIPEVLIEFLKSDIVRIQFASRSEAIRVAIREFLVKEIDSAKLLKPDLDVEKIKKEEKRILNDKTIVRLKVKAGEDEEGKPIEIEKTFKILRVLDGSDDKKKPKKEEKA